MIGIGEETMEERLSTKRVFTLHNSGKKCIGLFSGLSCSPPSVPESMGNIYDTSKGYDYHPIVHADSLVDDLGEEQAFSIRQLTNKS
jgi:hypothetical protein